MSQARVLLALAALLCCCFSARADMGRVHVSASEVKVSETSQKAIILHNLQEEVLILGTELKADGKAPIIRFIPFPSEPKVELPPAGAFDALAKIIAKYKLQFVALSYTKSGVASQEKQDIELRQSVKMGSHDITVIRIHKVSAFRDWVNNYFRSKGLPLNENYPKEEEIVADYVARGIDYFVLDFVEVPKEQRFIEPVSFRFKSKSLYYPLKTSNSFGGKGAIELFVVAPSTLCSPYSSLLDGYGTPPKPCLSVLPGMQTRASTSARLVLEENDLKAFIGDAETFFGKQPAFIQAINYFGDYRFNDDILVDPAAGTPKALLADIFDEPGQGPRWAIESLFENTRCQEKPDPGPCKGRFEAYSFDALKRVCKPFFWGGCQGKVPFETREDCENKCLIPGEKKPKR